MPAHRVPLDERFWAKVDKNGPLPELRPDLGECWLWTANTSPKGYGQIKVDGRLIGAHVVGYELTIGPVPEGLELDHLCRRTTCVRGAHLDPVTHAENLRRSTSGDHVKARAELITECPQQHPYDEANTRIGADGRRKCRACGRDKARAARARAAADR